MEYDQIICILREDHDKTQAEIAVLLNTSQSCYAQYENDYRAIPVIHVITLCKYYRVSADYVLGLTDDLPYPKR